MKFKKPMTIVLGASLILSAVGPAAAQAYAAESVEESASNLTVTNNELAKAIKAENVSQADLMEYKFYVKSQVNESGTVTPEGKISAAKKAIKFMVEHADTIPVKSVRDAVKKYGSKINKAVETIETYTWWGIANGLTKAGVPDKYADMIADFIVKYIL
ncbi:hypothetical protein H1W83_27935 (plasmid) [Priestia megaterium]|uniref:hypothetical protein n=1 Tax=Priestia megaterium TaxID=1404 RepID=UPI001EDB8706|nr:hypothetical protein [Priestia megaterium]UKJ83497.1 hypothetical protein H1W83_27935 [Priestia megaterium]